ncbi:MAG: lipopolysaccharide assembly protein LapA domain-containing protein [candidate division WOR-3 bacterium]
MTALRIALIILIVIAGSILAILNTQVEVKEVKVFWQSYYRVPLAVVMLYSYALGLLTVGIFAGISEIKLRREIRKEKKEKEALLEELQALRNLPLGE